MTTRPDTRCSSRYSHSVLVHDRDDELVEATRAFVEEGLASCGHVLVHGTTKRVGFLRDVLGFPSGLEYGYDEELYQAPTRTLFEYQRRLAEAPEGTDFWVTGTVPLGQDAKERAGWARYESAVNAALSSFSFRALCTYDARTLPESVIAAARATHPSVSTDLATHASGEYVDPAAFLVNPMANVPDPPRSPPSMTAVVTRLDHLARARHLVKTTALQSSALPLGAVIEFVTAVNEVAANGLVHGAPPVHISLWADVATLTCQVVDAGAGIPDPLTGYQYPEQWGPMGLWVARQMVDDMFIGSPPEGGCSILLTKT